MSKIRSTIVAYLALLAMSVPIPLLHSYYTDDVIATMRPVFKNADGSWTPMLMPISILFLLGTWNTSCGSYSGQSPPTPRK